MKTIFNYLLLSVLLAPFAFASAEESAKKEPLYFYVFVHDDISAQDRVPLRDNYFTWATEEIKNVTGRDVYVEYFEFRPSMTNFSYKSDDKHAVLNEWTNLIDNFRLSQPQPLNKRYKYLLLTNDRINADTLGVANHGNYTGIASIQTFQSPAHEFGHMLGATHEAAQNNYNGWWCSTIMGGYSSITSNCYVYSDANRKAIADYLKNNK